MTTQHLAPALAITILLPTLAAAAEDLPPAIRMSAACAPVGTRAPSNAPTITAESEQKTLYSVGEEVAVGTDANHRVQVGQRFYVRRPMASRGAPRAQHTIGWLRIVKASGSTATALIDFACDAVAVGDHLEPYVEPVLPPSVDRTDATGTPDRLKPARVLYGNDGRQLGGDRDFMLANAGRNRGVAPGARYAVYRGTGAPGELEPAFGEAVVVSVFADSSLLRITEAHGAVSAGDTIVPRVGGGTLLAAHAAADWQQVPQTEGLGEGSLPAGSRSLDESAEPIQTVSFEDVSFDFDRYTLKGPALALLDHALEVLHENPTLRIRIEGYSCNIGTAKYNLALGARRAKTVHDYLVRHGVTADRLTTTSYGEAQPKYDNTRKETRRLNRRAALVVNIQR
jgi:outer membrane protein OmpA-like peptidoglycan-associated protein